uniref:Uncharacterized protein n=1 Tax=Acrobeloides nanus TaxID=290746 RepID=A0A914CZN5_9BILA
MFEDIEPAPKSEYRLFLEEKLRKTLEDASNLTSYGSISAREQFEDVDDFERDLISYETKLPVINKRAIYGSSEESRQKKKPKLYDEILANESKYVKSIETVASHISSASPKVLHTPKRKKKTVLIDKSQIIESPKSDQSGSAKRPRSRNIRLNGEELQSVLHETEEPVAVAPSKKTQRVGPTLLALALNNKQKETKSTPQQRQQSTKTPKANSSKRKSSITVSPAVYKEDALVATTTTPKRQKSSKCQITEAATPNTTDGSKETPILVKKMDPTKNHCICNTPYDPKK